MAIKAVKRPPPIPVKSELQPDKCRGCVWGTWTGNVQLCLTPECRK
ncbi:MULTISPECIES: hypothetical protein [Paenibacillus]|nr:hypothetical protein [Paenibacillus pabuli]UPK45753.1 hypothetical protein KET34_10000 [Paenibacillus pabuli]